MSELLHRVARHAESQPAAIALSDESQSLSYAQLGLRINDEAQRLTALLAARCVSGRPVALAAP